MTDLAFTIILEFPKLANYVNEQGLSPLHLLANKPTAFRSGTHLSWIDKIIYYCKTDPTKTQLLIFNHSWKTANKLLGMPETEIRLGDPTGFSIIRCRPVLVLNKQMPRSNFTHEFCFNFFIFICQVFIPVVMLQGIFIPELKHHKEMHGEKKDSYCLGNTQTCVDFFLNMRNTTEGPGWWRFLFFFFFLPSELHFV